MLTGRAARGTTWVVMDEWIEQYSTPDDRPPARQAGARAPAKKAVAPRPPAKKKPRPAHAQAGRRGRP